MTQPAIQIAGQQSGLSLAIALDKAQQFVTEPFSEDLCTDVVPAQNFATSDPTVQDFINCTGRALTGQVIRQWRGAFSVDLPGDSKHFGWATAMAWGATSAPSPISASDVQFTITLGSATAGTWSIEFDTPTAPLAFNASAAVIQSAIDAVIGAGKLTAAGAGGTRTLTATAAGPYEDTDVRTPTLKTRKLTGGTAHTIAETTAGGPARSTYSISQDDGSDQPPAATVVLGYPNGRAWRLWDLVVNEMTPVVQDDGSFLVRVSFVWSGLFEPLPDYEWAACTKPKLLDIRDSRVLVNGADHTSRLRGIEYKFSNRPQPVFATVSKFAQAYLRTLPLENEWTAAFEEDPFAAGSVYSTATANGQSGTEGAFTMRYGSAADGATYANPESRIRLGPSAQTFGGQPSVGQVPIIVTPYDSDSSASKPTSLTLVTPYDGGYLAAA